MSSRIILVDLDNTGVNFDSGADDAVRRLFPDFPVIAHAVDSEYAGNYPLEMRATIRNAYTECNFFRNLPPIEGYVEALHKMLENGLEVFICSSPLSAYTNCVPEKFAWVEHHLGPKWVSRVVLTKDKTIVHGDILIDDHPEIKGAFFPTWEHILFDQPYNRHIQKPRLLHWRDWESIVYA